MHADGTRPSALVVDRCTEQAAALTAMLERLGARTQVVDAWAAARRVLHGQAVDVLFLHQRTWDRDREACQPALERGVADYPPVVLVADADADADAMAMPPAGVEDLLLLPCTAQELSWRLANAVRRRRCERAGASGAVLRDAAAGDARTLFMHAAYGRNLVSPHVHAVFRPRDVFNGDLFLLARRPHGGVLALLGDVTGHGPAAALFAPAVAQRFHELAAGPDSLAAVLVAIDRGFHAMSPTGVSLALQAVEIGAGLDYVEAANCGMPPLYLAAADGRVRAVESHSLAAGIAPALFLSAGTRGLPIAAGERVLLYSDGILEADDLRGRMFGPGRLRSAVQLAAVQGTSLLGEVVADHDRFTCGVAACDDASVVEIECVAGLCGGLHDSPGDAPRGAGA